MALAIILASLSLLSCGRQKEDRPGLPEFQTANMALLEYAARGDLEGIARSLRAGADVNYNPSMSPPSPSAVLGRAETPLINAARGGHTAAVRVLLQRGALANVRTIDETPLHIAAKRGHTEIVSMLLEAGASVNARVGLWGNEDAMIAAAAYGHGHVVSVLYRGGAAVKPDDLCHAVEVSDPDLVATYLGIIDARTVDCAGLSVLERARRLSPSPKRDAILRKLTSVLIQRTPR
jgi:hypothetical protein